MTPPLFPVALDALGRLAVAARPRGHDWLSDEVAGWKRAGVTLVVSLLTPDEDTELGLTAEAAECAAAGIEFVNLPIPDRGLPRSRTEFDAVVSRVVGEVNRDGMAVTHCRQSVGRAPLLAVAVLKAFGVPTEDATARVSAARGVRVPEMNEQAEWVAGG